MPIFFYSAGVLALTIGLVVFSYFDRTYRELGRVHPGRIHQHLDVFEADAELDAVPDKGRRVARVRRAGRG